MMDSILLQSLTSLMLKTLHILQQSGAQGFQVSLYSRQDFSTEHVYRIVMILYIYIYMPEQHLGFHLYPIFVNIATRRLLLCHL